MAAESGHEPNRSYVDQDGAFHVNGAAFYDDSETDISASLANAGALAGLTATATELNKLAGVTPGTTSANKALVVSTFKEINEIHTAALYLGAATGTLITVTGPQINLLTQGVAAGYKVARGEIALDGANPTAIATGLTTVTGFACSLKGTSAPGLGTCCLTYDISGATVNVYAWEPTGSGDCTLIASTGTETIGWVAIGT